MTKLSFLICEIVKNAWFEFVLWKSIKTKNERVKHLVTWTWLQLTCDVTNPTNPDVSICSLKKKVTVRPFWLDEKDFFTFSIMIQNLKWAKQENTHPNFFFNVDKCKNDVQIKEYKIHFKVLFHSEHRSGWRSLISLNASTTLNTGTCNTITSSDSKA